MAKRNVFTTARGKAAEARKNPAKKPGVSGDTPKPRRALQDFKKKK